MTKALLTRSFLIAAFALSLSTPALAGFKQVGGSHQSAANQPHYQQPLTIEEIQNVPAGGPAVQQPYYPAPEIIGGPNPAPAAMDQDETSDDEEKSWWGKFLEWSEKMANGKTYSNVGENGQPRSTITSRMDRMEAGDRE